MAFGIRRGSDDSRFEISNKDEGDKTEIKLENNGDNGSTGRLLSSASMFSKRIIKVKPNKTRQTTA